ncbi:MAG: AGE family epimerase/isomerase [Lachnospiraceae bacterium]|nr:AGE family epimerase/isomerase [Lachnospiraceae bacterium]
MLQRFSRHLKDDIIPFWQGLKDSEYGGYYGYMDHDLKVDKHYTKGCILNSRILWFFSNAYLLFRREDLKDSAAHAYDFMRRYCIDEKNGGILWSVTYDGKAEDTTKHTYNQAFAIYALSSYYDAFRDKEALDLAFSLFDIIEDKCFDGQGYLEAFKIDWSPESNEKLSENGVIAERTMNTLLHVFEAYTELYRVTNEERVRERLVWILNTFADKMYNPGLKRQEVFFDKDYKSLIDLHSYGHDIETSWLIDRGLNILGDDKLYEKLSPVTDALCEKTIEKAYHKGSLYAECEKGVDKKDRIWWVQAETMVGLVNYHSKHPEDLKTVERIKETADFIFEYMVDKRSGSEWYWDLDDDLKPFEGHPIVEPWKCPYHNGRMCMEVIRHFM